MLIERTVTGLHEYLSNSIKEIAYLRNSILDIGCGSGAWLARARDSGFERLVGVDYIQPDHVDGLELLKLDVNTDISDNLGVFDVVTCIEVIEHIENIGNLLNFIRCSLAPDGIAIITSPNPESLRARVRFLVTGKLPSFDEKGDPTHLCPILEASLQKMLQRRSLSIVSILQYPSDSSQTLIFGNTVKCLSSLLRMCLPDKNHGDISIYVIKHLREK
jgi:SAM-dependent methyltransferase